MAFVVGVRSDGLGLPALALKADVLVVADGLLGKTLEDGLLAVLTHLGEPVVHGLHHLDLDLRLPVMPVGVEAETMMSDP